ncbi:RHTO0S08e07910g1_1 [Rhodotorula toruloides]|uniref:RHTO0S08e07910g1_1 n=1 Tax=Rhodotorula toruloides TaxID=5286 RepID=A0A061B7R2_RHOTO|nr:RHTO0S08e07910g1_1 [Rhodotorula toruloides]
MTTWLTVLVAWLAALASGWERVLQADRAIDRWTAEITKTKSAIFVAGLVFVFYAIAVYVVLSWTTIGRRVSYRLVSSSLPFEGLCRGVQAPQYGVDYRQSHLLSSQARSSHLGPSIGANYRSVTGSGRPASRSRVAGTAQGASQSRLNQPVLTAERVLRSLRLRLSHAVDELLVTLAAVRAAEPSMHRSCAKFCEVMRTFPLNASPEALAVLYASKVEPLRTLWEGFTDLSQLDLRLIAEFLDIALLVNEVDVQHRIKTGAAPGDDQVRATRILKYVQRDLRRRVETYTSLMGLILRRIIVFVVLLVGGSTRILSWGHVAELAVVCCAWWAINDSTRHSLLHNENGLAFLDRVRSLAMSMFRLLEFDDLVIADFEYFQATKHLDEPDAHLCEAILAAVKGRRDLTDKLRDERAKNRTRAGSLRRSD